jgi:hypothetical protein
MRLKKQQWNSSLADIPGLSCTCEECMTGEECMTSFPSNDTHTWFGTANMQVMLPKDIMDHFEGEQDNDGPIYGWYVIPYVGDKPPNITAALQAYPDLGKWSMPGGHNDMPLEIAVFSAFPNGAFLSRIFHTSEPRNQVQPGDPYEILIVDSKKEIQAPGFWQDLTFDILGHLGFGESVPPIVNLSAKTMNVTWTVPINDQGHLETGCPLWGVTITPCQTQEWYTQVVTLRASVAFSSWISIFSAAALVKGFLFPSSIGVPSHYAFGQQAQIMQTQGMWRYVK